MLRKYDFSLNEIKCLYDNEACTNTVFSGYVKRIYDKYSYYNNINDYIQKIDTGNIDSIDNIIKALYEIEDMNRINKTYVMFFDEDMDDDYTCGKKFSLNYIIVILLGVIAFI